MNVIRGAITLYPAGIKDGDLYIVLRYRGTLAIKWDYGSTSLPELIFVPVGKKRKTEVINRETIQHSRVRNKCNCVYSSQDYFSFFNTSADL